MLRKIIVGFSVVGALMFSGCSKKLPVSLPPVGTPISDGNVNGDIGDSDAGTGGAVGSSNGDKSSFKKGAISSKGKYLGSDGVSKSGIKMLYFASDSYTLDDDQIKRLMSDLPKVKELTANGKVLVEGNCDEFGTDEYNHALGLKRAKAVKSLLINAGVSGDKIDTVSYGESNPVCTVNAPACHAKNRRVEINKI